MNVLFLNLPFASATRPAIGVSLLQAQLRRMGVASRIEYLNLRFARLFGAADYEYVADRTPSPMLAGDWVFSRCAFGRRDDADAEYLRISAERFGHLPPTRRGLATLVRARNLASGFLDDCAARIDWRSYDVIGFTSTFTQHVASLALARRVRNLHSDAVIVFGGANCEAEMGLQLHASFPFVDYVCSGEADLSLPELLRRLQAGVPAHDIPGVISRLGGRTRHVALAPQRIQDLDDLPIPAYEDYYSQYEAAFPAAKERPAVLMESSRGCWWGEKHHCTFCGLNGTSMTFRSKTAARVIEELSVLCGRYGTKQVEMVDNILDMAYFKNLLPELERRGMKLGLFYETKANLAKAQVLALRAAGVHAIQPGIESFSTDVLRIMRKGTSAVQNVQLLKWCREAGLKAVWNLIYGFPGETPADYEATVAVFEAIPHLQPPYGFSSIRMDRFSPHFDDAAALGFANVRPDRSYGLIYGLPEEALRNLAYYFEFDYADGRNPAEYVSAARSALGRWQRSAGSSSLLYADHGERLAIWDLRPCASRNLTILEGGGRDLYLYCDQHRSPEQIRARATAPDLAGEALEPFLGRMLRDRLMLRLDGHYLSLATKALARARPAVAEGRAVSERHLTF
jgi:ribosomal peptide maturation radical SAM protein 1